ncbi:hypothetical protein CSKR_107413 [Clonorchis sinensis]|uniref:Uncharacterized protein n=1 Tax=Clonorchis sinensis TaxID=79923 RepID=A0A8T1MUX4_CLOSI|nr:hypothetical protein CSKR_107413 [Clonorchis sinensis]
MTSRYDDTMVVSVKLLLTIKKSFHYAALLMSALLSAFPADSNPSESSSEISSSDSRHDGPKTLFTGPHAPRFCRYEYTAFEREPVPLLNPVVPCRPVLHTFSGASEWVSSSEVVSDSSFVKMDEKMSQQILGRLQGMKYDSENKVQGYKPTLNQLNELKSTNSNNLMGNISKLLICYESHSCSINLRVAYVSS